MEKSDIDLFAWGIYQTDVKKDVLKSSYGCGYYSDDKNLLPEEINSKCNYTWRRMLALCYSQASSYEKQRRGREYTICKEWLDYNTFKEWYDKNYYELPDYKVIFSPMCIKKNNTHFCPQLCAFVPTYVVGLLYGNVNSSAEEDKCNGVIKMKTLNGYSYKCAMNIDPELNGGSDTYYIGTYETEEEAFISYKIMKELYIKGVAYHLKDKISESVYNAMIRWTVERDDNTVKYENTRTRKDLFRLQK